MKSAKDSCKSITSSLFVILRQFGLFAEFPDGYFAVLPVALRTMAADHRLVLPVDLFYRDSWGMRSFLKTRELALE